MMLGTVLYAVMPVAMTALGTLSAVPGYGWTPALMPIVIVLAWVLRKAALAFDRSRVAVADGLAAEWSAEPGWLVGRERSKEFVMVDIIRLDPHDPLPEASPCALVIRRFGEDDPRAVITEVDFFGRNPAVDIAASRNGRQLSWEEAVQYAAREAEARGYSTLYAVDRTAGRREQEVLLHDGDHTVRVEELSDTDMEDGERGNTILDRPHDAGYLR